jgi:hypothetical protein
MAMSSNKPSGFLVGKLETATQVEFDSNFQVRMW